MIKSIHLAIHCKNIPLTVNICFKTCSELRRKHFSLISNTTKFPIEIDLYVSEIHGEMKLDAKMKLDARMKIQR